MGAPDLRRVVAIINDHESAGAPGWRDHRVELRLTHTPEWLYWTGQDGNAMAQTAFAEHVEGGLAEITEPDAAAMLEIAQTFHATSAATFRSATRLHSGEQRLQYDEEVRANAGAAGELEVPTELRLAVAPFIGEEPYAVKARLRYRVNAGNLRLSYHLDRPEAIVRDALEQIADRLADRFARTYMGDPPTDTR